MCNCATAYLVGPDAALASPLTEHILGAKKNEALRPPLPALSSKPLWPVVLSLAQALGRHGHSFAAIMLPLSALRSRASRLAPRSPVYRPLEFRDSIRIIQVSNEGGQLCGKLEHVRLSEKPSYMALSYVWGPPQPARTLKIDGHPIQITPNLGDFLDAALRASSPMPKLWIDAVCINQKDDDEKSVQVQMMRKIYEQTVQVVIWLGPGNEETAKLMENMARYSNALRRRYRLMGSAKAALADPRWVQEMGICSATGEIVDREGWERLGRFFGEQPWWTRMWTAQEYLPRTEKLFMCGSVSLPRAGIQLALIVFFELSQVSGFEFLMEAGFKEARAAEIFANTYLNAKRPPMKVYEVLSRLRSRQATDPRDKVFAALGLVDPKLLTDKNLEIDYSLSAERVMINIAEYLLRMNRNLDFPGGRTSVKPPELPFMGPGLEFPRGDDTNAEADLGR